MSAVSAAAVAAPAAAASPPAVPAKPKTPERNKIERIFSFAVFTDRTCKMALSHQVGGAFIETDGEISTADLALLMKTIGERLSWNSSTRAISGPVAVAERTLARPAAAAAAAAPAQKTS